MQCLCSFQKLKSIDHPKWFNSDIHHNLKCLRSMRKRLNSHPTQHLCNKIKAHEHLLQRKMQQAKTFYENKLIESLQSCTSPVIYSYIRSISGQNSLPLTMYIHGTSAKSDRDKAHLFNQYFHSVFTTNSYPLPPINELPYPDSFIGSITISELDVLKALNSLDMSKAMGCDGISSKILKHCALALFQPLHHLYCLSLSQCYLPEEWQIHLIRPIFKSGDKCSISNYRPISLLCIVSKILEKLVYHQIIDFLSNTISIHQFGFLRGCSTLQQLLLFYNQIFNTSSQTDVIYLDFKKAFDSVGHNELLLKVWNIGIRTLWMWIRAYLTNRLQCVSIGQYVSTSTGYFRSTSRKYSWPTVVPHFC